MFIYEHPCLHIFFQGWGKVHNSFYISACVCAKSLQSCLALCYPMGHSPSSSSVHGILQVRKLEWVAMPSSRGSSWPRDQACDSLSPTLAGGFFPTGTTWEALYISRIILIQLFCMLLFAFKHSSWKSLQSKWYSAQSFFLMAIFP